MPLIPFLLHSNGEGAKQSEADEATAVCISAFLHFPPALSIQALRNPFASIKINRANGFTNSFENKYDGE